MSTAPVESGLQDYRFEWVEEQTPGEPPSDPEWNAYSNEIQDVSVSVDGAKEGQNALGLSDFVNHYRGPEEAALIASYPQTRFPIDSSGNVVDPIAYPITATAPEEIPHLTSVARREVTEGGADGAGFREYVVALGSRPTAATTDGDPSASEPLPQELTQEAETVRPHIVHQPSSSGMLVVKSTDSSDTNDVIIESEGASTTETVTLPGSDPNEVETTSSFDDIDAVWVEGEHAGDIQIGTSDGSGSIDTELLETPLTGTNTDGVDSVEGIPPLGSGSHASEPTADGQLFLGTAAEWANESVGERVHTLNLSVEWDVSREPVQGTRRQAIDVGARSTVDADVDLAGPYETADKIKAAFRDRLGDLVYAFGTTGDPSNADRFITLHNSEATEWPDFTRSAGDTNYIPSVTLQGKADESNPAISITNNA